MTARLLSRLIIGTLTCTVIALVLFNGPSSFAAKGDRSAPTVPTSLMVTGVTETTVSLKWQASTDNSGKLSYRVRITNLNNSVYNSTATVSQTQTTYTARYLSTNSSYTFAVYAVDDNGNRSAESNAVNVQTPADTTPPNSPVLQATVLTPSKVQLTWTVPTDNIQTNCCAYSFSMNNSPLTQHVNWATAPAGSMSVIIRHLPPGSTNSFNVSASDYNGNIATSNTVNATTPPSSDTLPPTVPGNLNLVSTNGCAEVWLGWTEATDSADTQDQIEYEIYVNGVISPLPVSAGVDLDFVYGTAFGENIFTLKAVDRSGNSSAASSPLKLMLWPC